MGRGFFSIISKVAKEMDKQRFAEIKKQEVVASKKIDSFEEDIFEENLENIELELVVNYLDEVINIYDGWVENYSLLEQLRDQMDLEVELDNYVENLQYTIKMSKEVKVAMRLVFEDLEVPELTARYMSKTKEKLLFTITFHIKRTEVIIMGLYELIETGSNEEYPPDLANYYSDKASMYYEEGKDYMHRALNSVQ